MSQLSSCLLRRLSVGVAVAGLALAAPLAPAADVGQITCPVESLNAAERAEFSRHVRERGGAEEPIRGVVLQGIERCATEHGWSAAAKETALQHVLSATGAAESRNLLVAARVDADALERAVMADAALIAGARNRQFPEREFQDFIARLDPGLVAQIEAASTETQEASGAYVMFRALAAASRLDFAAQ